MSKNKDFKTRLKIEKDKLDNQRQSENEKRGSFIGNAFRLGTEMVAAVLVGTIIGFILDNWFDTKPLLMIVFFFIGSAAGILNVVRTAKIIQKERD
jgi:ATP synthase protein I